MNSPLQRLPFREIASYGIGAVGSNVIYALVATYIAFFYTEHVGLNFIAVGTLLMVVRIWDGIVDVIIGVMVDNTQTRWGKFRPYLLFGGFMTGLCAVACFISPDLSDAGKLIYAYGTYILWSMSYALADIPYWSLTPAMTNDPEERTRVVSVSRTGAQFGYWIVYVGALPAVKLMGGSWALVGVLAGIVCTVCFLVAFRGVREHCVVPRHEKQTVKSALRLFIENRPLRYLILACLLLEMVSGIRGAFTPYFFKYYLGREDLIPWAMGANITLVVAGCLFAPAIARRFGKVNAALYSYMAAGVAMTLMYFAGKNIPAFLVLTAVAGFFDGVSNIARMSCLADCVEYGQWKTGNRAEGLVFSVNIFKTKLASGLAGAIPMFLLGWIGCVPPQRILPAGTTPPDGGLPPNTHLADAIPQGLDFLKELPAQIPNNGVLMDVAQAAHTLPWIALFFTLILGIGSILSILPLFKYELTEKRFAEIAGELRRRKQA